MPIKLTWKSMYHPSKSNDNEKAQDRRISINFYVRHSYVTSIGGEARVAEVSVGASSVARITKRTLHLGSRYSPYPIELKKSTLVNLHSGSANESLLPTLEACGRFLCCGSRKGSTCKDNEPPQARVRRGARAGPTLGEASGPEHEGNGILGTVPISPSPASTSSQEDSCKPPPRNCYRLVILGSARVGKTAIVARFLSNKFEESYTPTIEDFHRKLYRIRGEVYQLDLLDTSGNHPFPAMRRLSFLTGDLFVVVFSMDSRETFEEAIRLREAILETKKSATQGATKSRNKNHNTLKVPMVIAGNKCDRDIKTVTVEEAQQYCAGQDDCCVFVEVSAKRNYHVDDLFYHLFIVAGLPLEMAPNHHRKVPLTFGSPTMLPPSQPKHKATLSIKRRLSDACGVVAPNVRRPSIRTDLMIMRTKTCSLVTGAENNTPGSRLTLRSVDSGKICCIQ